MSQRPIWITGAGGLIGHWLVVTAPEFGHGSRVVGLTRGQFDLTDFTAVRREFSGHKPQAVIHCAALSQSADCQSNPTLAHRLNVQVTVLLAELAAEIPFIFFSTDLVFDGRTGNYDESARVNPLSVYAESKVKAEQAVLANPKHTVVRTSLNSGPSPNGQRGFDEQIRKAWQDRRTLRLFNDEYRSPIAARVTARAVWELLASNRPGLYHIAGAERLSRWQIGQILAKSWPGLETRMEQASLKEYSGAPRAPDTSLNCAKAQRLLTHPLPRWSDWVAANSSSS